MEYSKKIDVIKAFAIWTVVYGHSIQFGSGEEVLNTGSFFENGVFQFIYSFHMPLFMLVSGYLFYFSLNRHTGKEVVKSRISTLLVPVFCWTFLPFFLGIRENGEISAAGLVKAYLRTAISNFWFLWAIFYCSIVVLAVNKWMKDSMFIYAALAIVSLYLPDAYNLNLYKYMYPFFVLGYLYHKRGGSFQGKYAVLPGFLAYLLMLVFFTRDSYIYTTGHTLLGKDWLNQLGIDIYRFVIGLTGSVLVIVILNHIVERIPGLWSEILAFIGRNSIGIYLISGFFFPYVLPRLTRGLQGINQLAVLGETTVITAGSLAITLLIKRVRIFNNLLLGGR